MASLGEILAGAEHRPTLHIAVDASDDTFLTIGRRRTTTQLWRFSWHNSEHRRISQIRLGRFSTFPYHWAKSILLLSDNIVPVALLLCGLISRSEITRFECYQNNWRPRAQMYTAKIGLEHLNPGEIQNLHQVGARTQWHIQFRRYLLVLLHTYA